MTQPQELLFEDTMGSGDHGFHFNYPTLFHLSRDLISISGRRLELTPAIVIPRVVLWLDTSKWQGEIDFDKMAATGEVAGLIAKCGQGTARDVQFVLTWTECKRVGIPRSSYWFWDSRVPPKVQAFWWWEWIKHDKGELMHFADYEESYGGPWGGWQNFKIFIQEFQRLSGLPSSRIGIYSAYYYWIAHSPTSATELAFFAQFQLWLAWYTTNPANVLIPRPWILLTLVAWQYGTNGPDGRTPRGHYFGADSFEIDESNYNGTKSQHNQQFGLGDTEPIPPPNGGTMYGNATGNITLRTGPAVSFAQYKIGGVGVFVLTGDRLESPEQRDGFWKLSKLTRAADGTVLTFPTDPAGGTGAWCGAAFIDEVDPPPPTSTLPDIPVTFIAGDDVTYIKQTVQITLKPKV